MARCKNGHTGDWDVYASGKRDCRVCKRDRDRVNLRCHGWRTPPAPDPVDAARWQFFCHSIEARIEAVRAAHVVDRDRVVDGRVGKAA